MWLFKILTLYDEMLERVELCFCIIAETCELSTKPNAPLIYISCFRFLTILSILGKGTGRYNVSYFYPISSFDIKYTNVHILSQMLLFIILTFLRKVHYGVDGCYGFFKSDINNTLFEVSAKKDAPIIYIIFIFLCNILNYCVVKN